MTDERPQTPPGPGVDSTGQAVIDPTKNVDVLVASAVKRLDDLRDQESQHVREIMTLRSQHDKDLREGETARIDAIRAVDVGAVNRAAEVAATQATTLATQVAVSAETLRTQVAATANAGTVALAAALSPIQKDIADLRQAQYEAQGQKSQTAETRAGSSASWIAIAGVVGLIVLLMMFVTTGLAIYAATKR